MGTKQVLMGTKWRLLWYKLIVGDEAFNPYFGGNAV